MSGPFASQTKSRDCDENDVERKLITLKIPLKSNGAEEDDMFVRLTVVGDSTVGKTTLLFRILRGEFKHTRSETIGVEFEEMRMRSKHPEYTRNTRVHLIDTAGTERYRAYVSGTLISIDGIFLVFNALDRASFESVVKDWNELVDSRNKFCVKALVATHIDLYEELPADKRWMDAVDMKAYAKRLGCRGGFHAVSSRTGAHVPAMFVEFVDQVIEYREKLSAESERSESLIQINANTKLYHKTCIC